MDGNPLACLSNAGAFRVSMKPCDGLCTARQTPLSHQRVEMQQQTLGVRFGCLTGADLLLGIKWAFAIPLH